MALAGAESHPLWRDFENKCFHHGINTEDREAWGDFWMFFLEGAYSMSRVRPGRSLPPQRRICEQAAEQQDCEDLEGDEHGETSEAEPAKHDEEE